jgi:hypothetical protein
MAATPYVSNAELTAALGNWSDARRSAVENDEPVPRMPDSIAEAALTIATRLSNKPNFYGYSFRDEMISDGLLSVCLYAHNFNPAKSNNGFAYFTQIIHNAFLRRLEMEQKQSYIVAKMLEADGVISNFEHLREKGKEIIETHENHLTRRRASANKLKTAS